MIRNNRGNVVLRNSTRTISSECNHGHHPAPPSDNFTVCCAEGALTDNQKNERYNHHDDTHHHRTFSSPKKTHHHTRHCQQQNKNHHRNLQEHVYTTFSSPQSNHLNVHSRNTCHFVTPISLSKAKQTFDKKQLIYQQSRAHLKHVQVLQRTAIFIEGLPKKYFQTAKAIENEFRKYGVITNCLTNPKGISVEESCVDPISITSGCTRSSSISCDEIIGPVYIRFLNERSAANAILATNGQILNRHDVHNDHQFRLRSCFVHNRYCDKFLGGSFCQDLNCILLHEELPKDDKKKSGHKFNSAQKSPSYRNSHNCNSPLKEISSSSASAGKNNSIMTKKCKSYPCSNSKKGYVQAVLGFDTANHAGGGDTVCKEERSPMQLTQCKMNDIQKPFVTPQTPRRFGNDVRTPPLCQQNSDTRVVDILSATHCNRIHVLQRERSRQSDLPAKRLFCKSTMNNVIGPPVRKTETYVVNGIDNPWAIHSPIMIENGHFGTIYNSSHNYHSNYQTKHHQNNNLNHHHSNTKNYHYSTQAVIPILHHEINCDVGSSAIAGDFMVGSYGYSFSSYQP